MSRNRVREWVSNSTAAFAGPWLDLSDAGALSFAPTEPHAAPPCSWCGFKGNEFGRFNCRRCGGPY